MSIVYRCCFGLLVGLVVAFASRLAVGAFPLDLKLVSIGVVSSDTIVAVRSANDGSGRLFLVERGGIVDIFHESRSPDGTSFLDITSDVDTEGEGGLLGLAFHPDFGTNGYLYVYYTRDGTGGDPLETVIERFSVSAENENVVDTSTRREIYALGQPASNHNGGDLHFGPDGYLYVVLGDGGASSATSQNLADDLGKILRIDPCDDDACLVPFAIPPGNPFVQVHSANDQIWASGLRNPYRWSFDRNTGDMFIGDVGAGSREEVDFQPASSSGGENYGWNCREGDIGGPGSCTGTFVDPIMVYPHANGDCSIVGGYRYRGCIDGIQGVYVFADFCSARIWFGVESAAGDWSFTEWDDLSGRIYGFGEDEYGELYVSQGSQVYRFQDDTICFGPIFADGFESGDTAAWELPY